MATTAKGTPYVQSSDLVSAYPTSSLALATHIDDNLAYNALTFNNQTGTTYTFALADATLGKMVTASNASAQTYTIPPQSSVTWVTGSIIRLTNIGAGAVTIVGGSGVTVSNALSTLAQWDSVNILRTGSDSWAVLRGGGLPKAVYSSATVPPANTFTSGSQTIYVFKTSCTVTFSQAGTVEILVVGGGGGGGITLGSGGGGGGGVLATSTAYVGTSVVLTIGAGGAVGSGASSTGAPGSTSKCGDYYAVGGGGGAGNNAAGRSEALIGGSGGGGCALSSGSTNGAAGVSGLGNAGGNGGGGTNNAGGGGGGGGAVGAVGVNATSTGGNGGVGATSTILNTTDASTAAVGQVSGGSVYYGGGGGGGGTTNGTNGLGNGAAYTGGGGRAGQSGQSGIVIIKVG